MATNPLYPIGGRDSVWEGWGALNPVSDELRQPASESGASTGIDPDAGGEATKDNRIWFDEYKAYWDKTTDQWFDKTGRIKIPDPRPKTEPGVRPPVDEDRYPYEGLQPPGGTDPWTPAPTNPTRTPAPYPDGTIPGSYGRPGQYANIPGGSNIWEIGDYLRTGQSPAGGTAAPTVNMPDAPGFAPPNIEAGRGGAGNRTPIGAISGALRNFSPHGEVLGQYSAPRTYGGLARSTG